MMISDLNDSGQHLRGHPARRGPVRFASVAVLEEGGYKIVRRDTTRKEHQVTHLDQHQRHRPRPHRLVGRPPPPRAANQPGHQLLKHDLVGPTAVWPRPENIGECRGREPGGCEFDRTEPTSAARWARRGGAGEGPSRAPAMATRRCPPRRTWRHGARRECPSRESAPHRIRTCDARQRVQSTAAQQVRRGRLRRQPPAAPGAGHRQLRGRRADPARPRPGRAGADTGPDGGRLTGGGELNQVAATIATGRDMVGCTGVPITARRSGWARRPSSASCARPRRRSWRTRSSPSIV